ncbi:unnamed protein product [Rangifer tarandus platyrhynchus]|uniref:Uncharacterized protein n=2 Tax=Rangifer tarandus platyrhynchus TaxID=3082113 RepID=A0ACB0EHY6_RANTA|nr:unnamed protein product [Rangifer tarandus platyrhynchus]CAI9700260.1 unnamed protein product [Rangifer tarandus platyrhynchus]
MRRRVLGAGRDAKGRQASPRAIPAEPGGHPEAEARTRAGPRAGAQVSPGAGRAPGAAGAWPAGARTGGSARPRPRGLALRRLRPQSGAAGNPGRGSCAVGKDSRLKLPRLGRLEHRKREERSEGAGRALLASECARKYEAHWEP